MPTRAEILDTLASSQTQVLAFFHGLSPQDLERPATASEWPGAAPWNAKDHLAHLVRSEHNIRQLLRRVLAGEPRDVILREQYPKGMPLPGILGDLDALTPEEEERLGLAIAQLNQDYVTAHHDDPLERVAAEYRAARQELLDLLHQFTDEQLAALVPSVVGEATAGDMFAGRAGHATEHMSSVEEGLRRRGKKGTPMSNRDEHHFTTDLESAALPAVVDRATWQAELDTLRVREKAHTRAGDAIAAARRRLPMVEVDSSIQLVGAHGPVTLLEVFEGRRLLIAYFQMWHTGQPAEAQCEGCTFSTTHINELSYLHSRDVTYATFCEGPYEESSRYRDFMGWTMPWYSVPPEAVNQLIADRHFGILVSYLRDGDRVFETYWTTGRGNEVMAPSYGLLDMTAYGRQEMWEDSPEGWPRRWGKDTSEPNAFRLHGRPISQWSRLAAGRSDDLGSGATATTPHGGQIEPGAS